MGVPERLWQVKWPFNWFVLIGMAVFVAIVVLPFAVRFVRQLLKRDRCVNPMPSYSPELNPDERLNADLKRAITTGVPKRTGAGLPARTRARMDRAKATPERMKAYVKDRHVSSAAESM